MLRPKLWQRYAVTWSLRHTSIYLFSLEMKTEKISPHKSYAICRPIPQHWPAPQCQGGSSAFLFWLSLYVEVTPNSHWLDEPHREEKGRCRSDAQRGSWIERLWPGDPIEGQSLRWQLQVALLPSALCLHTSKLGVCIWSMTLLWRSTPPRPHSPHSTSPPFPFYFAAHQNALRQNYTSSAS